MTFNNPSFICRRLHGPVDPTICYRCELEKANKKLEELETNLEEGGREA